MSTKLPIVKISMEISSCVKCPFKIAENAWSSDGWDRMEDWRCAKKGQMIAKAVEWHEEKKIEIPDWCPFRVS